MSDVNEPCLPLDDADAVDVELSRAIADGRVAEASRVAIERQKAKGLAVTFLRGDTIVTQYPDGREEVLGTIARRPHWTPRHALTSKSA